jgi:hypothetical protein
MATKNLNLKGNNPMKLFPRFIGPFKCVGNVSYKIGFPDHMKIHNVFRMDDDDRSYNAPIPDPSLS